MVLLLSIVIILIVLFLFFRNNHKALAFIFLFTLFNGDFQFNVGVSLNVYHFITIIYLPNLFSFLKRNTLLKKLTRPLVYELLIIFFFGILFGYVMPFDDPFANFRSFTQQANMRALISFSRMFLEFFSILLVVYWLMKGLVSLQNIIKYFSYVIILSVVIALILFIYPPIFRYLFPNFAHHFIGTRFTGLVGEPRTFGRFCSFGLVFLLYYKSYYNKKERIIAIILSSIGIVISLSASAFIVTGIGLGLYFIHRRNITSLTIVLFVSLIGYIILKNNDFFMNTTMDKIQSVISVKQTENSDRRINEPNIFTKFEVFDRSALNFLYSNPQYLLFGVGPNLISIPASKYLPPELVNSEVYGNGINSVPTTLFVNIISRSGFIGLFLQLQFFILVFNRLFYKYGKRCFFTTFLMSLITATNIFFLIIGISLYLVLSFRKNETYYGE